MNLKEIKIIKDNEQKKISLMYDTKTNKKYIQKCIHDDKREIYKLLQKINHPNIPKIINIEFNSDTIITEEYINAIPLSDFMANNMSLNKSQIKRIAKQILSAMIELHKNNIIHRDIKPDNVLIDKNYNVWLIDYNIARIYREDIRKDTEVMGTFGYAPIEQYGMMPTDFKTDIYSFGVTLEQLLKQNNIKGMLIKIAEKCKKLDPSERYKTAKKIKNAINFGFVKNPLIYIAPVTAAIVFSVYSITKINTSDITKNDDTAKTEEVATVIEEDSQFIGFNNYSDKEMEYFECDSISDARIFWTDIYWEHLIFLDDVEREGKIKLGKNNTYVNAKFNLNDGELSASLSDEYGNEFDYKFKFENQYDYQIHYDENIRKNADIICRDLDGDEIPELLIGLNEGTVGVSYKEFYNYFNYCIAWCIKYDEENGFTLCEGDMFSEYYSFTLFKHIPKVNVAWEDSGDIMGYYVKDNKIVSF